MLALKQKKMVRNNKVVIDIPEGFGEEVEVIVLSTIDETNIQYWSEDEIRNMGKTIGMIKDIDGEDYSKW